MPPRVADPLAGPALAASVAIDLDHVPIVAAMVRGEELPRPWPHTFATPLVLAAAGAALREHRVLGAALGVAAHLARDLFTGPGVRGMRLPVGAHAVVLSALLLAAVSRRSR